MAGNLRGMCVTHSGESFVWFGCWWIGTKRVVARPIELRSQRRPQRPGVIASDHGKLDRTVRTPESDTGGVIGMWLCVDADVVGTV